MFKSRARELMHNLKSAWASRSKPRLAIRDNPRPAIGIVTQYTPRKGMTTLCKSVEFALDHKLTIFPVRKISRLDREFDYTHSVPVKDSLMHDRVVPPGCSLTEWIDRQDIVIFVERVVPKAFHYCRSRGVKSLLMILLDWLPFDKEARESGLALADAGIVMGQDSFDVLKNDGCENIRLIPASLDWDISEQPQRDQSMRRFYFNIGVGGSQNRRNVPMVMEIFNKLLPKYEDSELILKMLPRARKYVSELGELHPRIRVIEQEMTVAEMIELQRSADISLFPTRFEGLGFPLLESLHASVPVLTTDAPPMNEFIQDQVNGLLIKAERGGGMGYQKMWDLDQAHFESLVESLMQKDGWERLQSLQQHATTGLAERKQRYRELWQGLIRELQPKILVISREHPGGDGVDWLPAPGTQAEALTALESLSFDDQHFDEVVIDGALEYFAKAKHSALIKEWRRVLKVGGLLHIRCVDLRALALELVRGKIDLEFFSNRLFEPQQGAQARIQSVFDEALLKSLMEQAGVTDIERAATSKGLESLDLIGRRRD